MLPSRQVFYRQVNDKQKADIREMVVRQIGAFLKQERLRCGRSINEVSIACQLEPDELSAWEKGEDSPPCMTFMRVVTYYGSDTYKRAMELDLDLQIKVAKIRNR